MAAKKESAKEEVISALAEARRSILEAAMALAPERREEVFLGSWSVMELLAHLVGWDVANAEAVQAILEGRMPPFYDHYDAGWKTFNAGLVARYRRDDFAGMVADVQESHRRLLAFLQTLPPEEFERDRGLRSGRHRVTIAYILRAEAGDERKHGRQVAEFAERG